MADLQKVDTGLFMAWRAYQDSHDKNEDDGISISLRFEGELESIEALGFKTQTVLGREALGVVKFRDIEALDAHPGVLWMAAGQAPRMRLDTAVGDIKARASAAIGGPPVDGLWHAEVASGAFTNVADATGKDVFVAIIDTGIDYQHPMFMSDMGPPKKTRIFRIWDQGLKPAALPECPDAALLASNPDTYGIEYKQAEIEAALNGGPAINHKDCIGHGTHVAGIAAGGTKFFTPGGDAKFVGVAPEASIIAVKLLDNPDSIRYFAPPPAVGAEVGHLRRLQDAVMYCLRLAKDQGKPVVVNMSFGDSSQPGDGLDERASFFDDLMDPIFPESSFNFPKKAVLVKAAGNDGDPADRQTARIVVPASGQITVPVQLKDTRGGEKKRWKRCAKELHTPPVGVDFWYRRATVFDSVKFALRLPDQVGFSGDMPIGGNLDRGFVPKIGPPPRVDFVSPTTNVHRARVRHEGNPPVNHPTGLTPLRRHKVAFWVEPKESGGTISYHPGIYEIRIKAPVGTVIFAMCDRQFWARGLEVTFEIATTMMDGSALDPGIILTNESSATDTLGRHVVTVAAYDDKDGVAGPDKGEIAAFSSRGPLRDFSNPPLGPIAVKPDIAAPGVKIMSAEGFDTEALVPRVPSWFDGIRFKAFRGTSMAAPMVAGVIALMLDKKSDMDINEVRTHLNAVARAAVKPSAAPDSTNAYGSGLVDALESYKRLP